MVAALERLRCVLYNTRGRLHRSHGPARHRHPQPRALLGRAIAMCARALHQHHHQLVISITKPYVTHGPHQRGPIDHDAAAYRFSISPSARSREPGANATRPRQPAPAWRPTGPAGAHSGAHLAGSRAPWAPRLGARANAAKVQIAEFMGAQSAQRDAEMLNLCMCMHTNYQITRLGFFLK